MAKNSYVVFVDILGFKAMLDSDPSSAKKAMADFTEIVRRRWTKHGLDHKSNKEKISCLMVSDCAIIHIKDEDSQLLEATIDLLVDVFREAIFEKGCFLLRAAICEGSFEELPTNAPDELLENFESRLFLGKAYVDALTLEGAFKGAQIAFYEEMVESIKKIEKWKTRIATAKITINGAVRSVCYIKWQNINDILDGKKCKKFVSLASKSEWRDQYYATLDMFFDNASDYSLVREAIYTIWRQLEGGYHENSRSTFISNAFRHSVYSTHITDFLYKVIDNSYYIDKYLMSIPVKVLFCPDEVKLFAGDEARSQLMRKGISAEKNNR